MLGWKEVEALNNVLKNMVEECLLVHLVSAERDVSSTVCKTRFCSEMLPLLKVQQARQSSSFHLFMVLYEKSTP